MLYIFQRYSTSYWDSYQNDFCCCFEFCEMFHLPPTSTEIIKCIVFHFCPLMMRYIDWLTNTNYMIMLFCSFHILVNLISIILPILFLMRKFYWKYFLFFYYLYNQLLPKILNHLQVYVFVYFSLQLHSFLPVCLETFLWGPFTFVWHEYIHCTYLRLLFSWPIF
jgi:hypothetical protein